MLSTLSPGLPPSGLLTRCHGLTEDRGEEIEEAGDQNGDVDQVDIGDVPESTLGVLFLVTGHLGSDLASSFLGLGFRVARFGEQTGSSSSGERPWGDTSPPRFDEHVAVSISTSARTNCMIGRMLIFLGLLNWQHGIFKATRLSLV